jgi:mRNA interferase RelE/StbE
VSYAVIFSPGAIRDMDRIPPRIVPAIVEFVYGDLAESPRRVGKALSRELEGRFSARRGPYRVIYTINEEEQTVGVLRVDHRADVYRPK